MKQLIIFTLLISAFAAHAGSNFKATVDDLFCGEMDPFVVGDICLVQLTKENGKKLAIVLDMDIFYGQYDDDLLESGDQIIVNEKSLSKIYNREVVEVLRDFDEDYYYVQSDELSFVLLDDEVISKREMKKFLSKIDGYFHVRSLPNGYTAKKVNSFKVNENFGSYLQGATEMKLNQWEDLVYESEDYEDLSYAQKEELAKNPKAELGVKYLLEVHEVYEIQKNGNTIGLFIEVLDHVQAAVYQDGAWINMFLTTDQKVLKTIDESA